MEIHMCMSTLDGKKGLGEDRSGCPCTLARWKTLSLEKEGRSQTPKAVRERQGGRKKEKSYKTFLFCLRQIIVKPWTWCGNSKLLYMKHRFNPEENLWEAARLQWPTFTNFYFPEYLDYQISHKCKHLFIKFIWLLKEWNHSVNFEV